MNKLFRSFLIVFCLFVLVSCGKKESIVKSKQTEDIEYPSYTIEEYNKMESYTYSQNIEDISYKYTYFFKDDMCVNAKEELTFTSNMLANEFYKSLEDTDDYIEISINNNKVIYYYNPEYFAYMMYPKDALIELLNKNDLIEE